MPLSRLFHGALFVLFMTVVSWGFPATAKEDGFQPIPSLSSHLVDAIHWLPESDAAALRKKLEGVASAGKVHIAVLLIDSTKPETIEQYSIRVAEAWRVGEKKADNGIIIIVAKSDRKIRIEVGYGLEGLVPDVIVKRIISDDMSPLLKQGKLREGLELAIDRIVSLTQKEGGIAQVTETTDVDKTSDSIPGGAIALTVVLAIISAACFYTEGWAVIGGLAVDAIGGLFLGGTTFGMGIGVGITIIAIVAGVLLRFGGADIIFGMLSSSGGSSSGSVSSGGDFGGGGASGDF